MSHPTRDQVFISYSHADRRWLEKLQTMLTPLMTGGRITAWDDTIIKPGQRWREETERALTSAQVAVLLVSDNFLASDFIARHELSPLLNAAKEYGLKILWVALNHCLYEKTEISNYQAAHDPERPLDSLDASEQKAVLADICRKIKEAVMSPTPNGEAMLMSIPLNTNNIDVARLSDTTRELFGREHELDMLDKAWADPDTNVISIIAWGGVGKSALVNHWRHMMAPHYGGAEKVYAWSFYRQGTVGHGVSADEFIANALHWFGDANPTEGSQWGKGDRLAKLIGKHRTLLLLDGLEPLQDPPRSGLREGVLREDSMRALLRRLAAVNPGLCVITSRLPISDLTDCELYNARRINLEHLSSKDGAKVLKAQGVIGEEAELEQASLEFGGHALALTLLGGYLRDVHDGDISQRDKVGLLKEDEERGGHARRVMASYEKWFDGYPELAVLNMIALFDRPAEVSAIAALREKSDIPAITEPLKNLSEEDWRRTLARLRNTKLIAQKDPNQPDTLDAHPLVREYFKKQLKQNYVKAWKKGNEQLFEYLCKAVEDRPETKEEIYYLYRAVAHACQADLHKRAFISVYYDRIQRGQEFFAPSKLGTVGADIAALSCFFDVPWEHPVANITGRYRALLLGQAGYRLWMLGRLEESIPPMKLALEADVARAKEASDDKVALKAWKYASVDANTLTSIYLSLGDLTQALTYSEDDVKYALNSGDRDQIVSALSTRGDVLHHQGDLLGSQEIFERAERSKGGGKQSPSFPHSLGHRRRDLLLSQGKYGEIQDTVRGILKSPKSEPFDLIDSALLYLSLGQANLFQAAHKYSEAKANLELAMDYLLRAGRVVHIPRGRLALADLHLMTGEFGEAKFNLDEALSTATRNHTELHQADCYLKYAWLYLEQGEKEKAQESWSKAKEVIDWMGYHQRDKDIKDVEGRFKEVVTASDSKPPLKDTYTIVELTINRDFDSFSADDQKQFLDKIKDLLNLSTDIPLVSKKRGSVILKIEITSEQAKQLLRLYEDGVLIELNVEYAKVIDGSVNGNKAPTYIYDVFMCHNSEDKPEVKRIASRLRKDGIRPWLDEWELRPGLSWQQALEEQIENIKSAAVFLGNSGIGPWQDLELNAFIRRFLTRQCPVIPVILRTCTEKPVVPIFLGGMTWVNFKKRSPDPYEQLKWGITGEKGKE